MNDQTSSISALLDKLLAGGQQLATKGQDMAEQQLNIPAAGPERDTMLNGMKKGALASAVLLGLLGTKTGRSLTGTAIKLGGLAALGTAAYKGYQNWQQTGDPLSSTKAAKAVHELPAEQASARSLLMLRALVSAAHADGHIDDQEVQAIRHELIEMHLPESVAAEVEAIVDAPLSAHALASMVDDQQAAAEVYLASRIIINQQSSSQEQGYLQDLAQAMGLSKDLQRSLDQQIA